MLVPWAASAGKPYYMMLDEGEGAERIGAVMRRVREGADGWALRPPRGPHSSGSAVASAGPGWGGVGGGGEVWGWWCSEPLAYALSWVVLVRVSYGGG